MIQATFNEAIMPITVSGQAQDLVNYIAVKCLGGADCNQAGPGFFSCGSDTCVDGKFIVSNQYRTVEFISNNQCGVNSCGEPVYCLPETSQITVELKAASLASCGADNCASRSPYIECANGHCHNSAGVNYPLSASPFDGIMDLALNSLDGNRDDQAVGPVSFYDENIGDQQSGDSFKWSFSTNDQIDIDPPIITRTSITHEQGNVNLTESIKVDFSEVMMASSLKTGSTFISNGRDRFEHKAINLWNLSGSSTGFWVTSENIDNDPPDGEMDWTQAEIRHVMFADGADYRARVGSGVRDNYQNCFKPSSSDTCAGGPSCCGEVSTAASECSE